MSDGEALSHGPLMGQGDQISPLLVAVPPQTYLTCSWFRARLSIGGFTACSGTPNLMNDLKILRSLAIALPILAVTARAEGVTAAFDSATTVPITAAAYSATRNTVEFALNFTPPVGTDLTVIRNTGPALIQGFFDNLAHSQTVFLSHGGLRHRFMADYRGGDGNDLILRWAGNRAFALGLNSFGQLGTPASANSIMAAPVDGSGLLNGKTLTGLAAGGSHTLACCADGTLAAWGSNTSGQLGVVGSPANSSVPVAVYRGGILAGKTVTAVAAGDSHSLALCLDGTLAAWGNNAQNQLGDGTITTRKWPVEITRSGVLAGRTVIAIAAGYRHNLALCTDGTLVAWGFNATGQLGTGDLLAKSSPVVVNPSGALAGKSVVAIAAGYTHSLALCADGTLAAWGSTLDGVLGNGESASGYRASPVDITGSGILAGKTVVKIAAGAYHNLALCADGTLATWGANSAYQLGLGDSKTIRATPTAISLTGALAGKTIASLNAGYAHSAALCTDGTPVTWGERFGQAGSYYFTPYAIANRNVRAGEKLMTLAPGPIAKHVVTLTASPVSFEATLASLTCTPGTFTAPVVPGVTAYTIRVPRGTTVFSVTANLSDLKSTMTFNGVPLASGVAVEVPVTGDPITLVVTAESGDSISYHLTVVSDATLASLVVSGGTLMPGFLPDVTHYDLAVATAITAVEVTPTATDPTATITVNDVPTASGSTWLENLAVGVTPITVRVTTVDGAVLNYVLTVHRPGPLAFTFTEPGQAPVTAPGYDATGNTVRLELAYWPAAGTALTLINNTGPCNIGGRFSNLAQGQTISLFYHNANYRFVANYYGGSGNDLVLVWANNAACAWGQNKSGQLGDGNNGSQTNVPVLVTGTGALAGKTILALAAGGSHTLALCADGTVAAWGSNSYGQLGNNTTTVSKVPVAVTTTGILAGRTVVAIAAGYAHSLALCADGTLAAWGYNGTGQLGNGTTSISPVSVPQAVTISPALTGRTPVSIAAGSYFNVVVCAEGTLITWGYNTTGQLGTGTLTNSSLPVAVTASPALSGKLPAAVAAGSGHGLALCADGTLVAWGGGLGSGNTTVTTVPLRVTASGVLAGQTVVAIAAGGSHSLVLLTDGTLASWGYNYDGQLGNGNQVSAFVPVLVDRTGVLAGQRVTGIAAGASHSLAFGDSIAFAWGYNKSGTLGDGSSLTRSNLPVLVATSTLASGTKFAMVASGPAAEHSLAVVGLPLVADATLSGLTLDPGSLSPNFNSGTLNYTASVPAATTTLRVTPTATDANATIRVNGDPVVSGTPSEAIAITSIPTTITVQVIAQNGADNKIYIITITNVAPSFAGYAVATPYQTAVTIPLAKLLANAADANGDALTVTAAGPLSANGGVVTLQASGIGYTPPNNFSGVDTFPVTITDAGGASVVGAVTVAVGPPPDAGGAGVNPPVLTTLPDGKVAIAFHGIPGRGYVVQRSVGGLDNWTTLATLVADASGRIFYTDESPPVGSAFYRLGTP